MVTGGVSISSRSVEAFQTHGQDLHGHDASTVVASAGDSMAPKLGILTPDIVGGSIFGVLLV